MGLELYVKVPRPAGALWVSDAGLVVIKRTGWSKEMNVAVMKCYFLSRPFDEEGKPIRGFRKRMHNIWKERQGLKVTEQRLCDQARVIRMNGWLTELDMNAIKIFMMNENANKI